MTIVKLTMENVEWTNPLTGDGEYCEVEFEWDTEEEGVSALHSVIWERSAAEKVDCPVRYIEFRVEEELIEDIESRIARGELAEEIASALVADAEDSGSED